MLSSTEESRFLELFEPMQEEIYRVAYIYLKNREDARDALQETAYRCFKSFKRLRNTEYFRTWAIRTAINCSLDILRRRSRSVPLDENILSDLSAPSPESGAEDRIFLDKLLNSLNAREKSVILLRHLYGLELSEISKTLRLPLGTVKSTLYRAMKKLEKESDSL